MASISFQQLYSRFYAKVEAYDLFILGMTDELRIGILCSYIHSVLAKPNIRRLFSSLTIIDDIPDDADDTFVTDDDIVTLEEAEDIFDKAKANKEATYNSGDNGDLESATDNIDVLGTITYTLEHATDDVADEEFLVELIGLGMVLAWIEPKVNSVVNMRQLISTADEKYYSQAAHMSQLQACYDAVNKEISFLIQNRGFINNDYLDGRSASASLRS